MATKKEYIEWVVETLKSDFPDITYRPMMGEYIAYINGKPLITVCDNTVYVKIHDNIIALMSDAEVGYPYDGARLHYILDIEDKETAVLVLTELEKVTPLKKPRKTNFKIIT